MAQEAERSAEQVADAVDYVCGHLGQVRAVLVGKGGAGPLDAALSDLRDGRDPRPSLENLHRALRVAGDALGVYGHARNLTVAGDDEFAHPEAVFLCPRDAFPCARFTWPSAVASRTATGTAPHCEITGRPLRRDTVG